MDIDKNQMQDRVIKLTKGTILSLNGKCYVQTLETHLIKGEIRYLLKGISVMGLGEDLFLTTRELFALTKVEEDMHLYRIKDMKNLIVYHIFGTKREMTNYYVEIVNNIGENFSQYVKVEKEI